MVFSLEQEIYCALYKTKQLNVIQITNIIKHNNETLYETLGNIPGAIISTTCIKLYKLKKLKRDDTTIPFIMHLQFTLKLPYQSHINSIPGSASLGGW